MLSQAEDDTGHSSDDSYALPVLSSYALALLSADNNEPVGSARAAELESTNLSRTLKGEREYNTEYRSSNGHYDQNSYRPSTLVAAARERRRSREASNSPYAAPPATVTRTRHFTATRDDSSVLTSSGSSQLRHLASSDDAEPYPASLASATPYHYAEKVDVQSAENDHNNDGLATPAFTRPTIGPHNEPASQYRSIFRKSKPGRLGPPKRALRRESQEGENTNADDAFTSSKSPSASPRLNNGDRDADLKYNQKNESPNKLSDMPKALNRLRLENDEEIPLSQTRSSSDRSQLSQDHSQLLSKESDPNRQSMLNATSSGLEISDMPRSRASAVVADGVRDTSPYTKDEQGLLNQFSSFSYSSERRRHPSRQFEAVKELTNLIHKSQSPKARTLALDPSPPFDPPDMVGDLISGDPTQIYTEKLLHREAGQTTPFAPRHHEQRYSQLASPQIDGALTSIRQRPLSNIYYDDRENLPRSNNIQADYQTNPQAHQRLQGRQLLTPLSSNIIRPLRTSTPPPECKSYDPPPKMSDLDVPRPTPKAVTKKQKNTVVVSRKR